MCLFSLTVPSITSAISTLTLGAPAGSHLERSTPYWIVFSSAYGVAGQRYDLMATRSTTKCSVSANGWSIDNRSYRRDPANAGSSWMSSPDVVKIAVAGRGATRVPDPPAQYIINLGIEGIEAVEFGSGVLGVEPPDDGDPRRIALGPISDGGSLKVRLGGIATP